MRRRLWILLCVAFWACFLWWGLFAPGPEDDGRSPAADEAMMDFR
jgi:hypothetical protein